MDSPVYKKVRSQMILMTKQVMDLMDKLKAEKEKDNPIEEQKLNKVVDDAIKKDRIPVLELRTRTDSLKDTFIFPDHLFSPVGKGNQINISYSVPRDKYQQVRSCLQVNSAKEVGQLTFEYFCENEL